MNWFLTANELKFVPQPTYRPNSDSDSRVQRLPSCLREAPWSAAAKLPPLFPSSRGSFAAAVPFEHMHSMSKTTKFEGTNRECI
jgi:hypothetical protein